MTRTTRTLSTVLFLLAVASPALAEIDQTPASASTQSWEGAYLGISLSLPTGGNKINEQGVPTSTAKDDWEGTLAYLTGGYDWQRGSMVYGAALDIAIGTLDARSVPGPLPLFGCVPPGCDTEVANYAALRGRLGYAAGDVLIYGTLGAARADVEASSAGPFFFGEGAMTGWVAGLGVEYRISQRATLDLSYLHTDLGRLDLPTDCSVDCFTEVSFGQIRLGTVIRW